MKKKSTIIHCYGNGKFVKSHILLFLTHVYLGFKLRILMPEDARGLPKQNAVLDVINIIFVSDSKKSTTNLYLFKYKQYFVHLCISAPHFTSLGPIFWYLRLSNWELNRIFARAQLFCISQNCQFLQNVHIFLRYTALPHTTLDSWTKWRWCLSAQSGASAMPWLMAGN
jgi:hypothetical protein